jgi:hypothetical protein
MVRRTDGVARPAGVVLADGTAMHARCGEEFHVERIKRLAENAFLSEAQYLSEN